MTPIAPPYYAALGECSILDSSKNLTLVDISSVNDLSRDHNPVSIDLALNNTLSLPQNNLRTRVLDVDLNEPNFLFFSFLAVKNGDNPEKALAQGFANEVEKAGSGAENVTNCKYI
ncbi:hypothetical protein TNCV_4724261 [Trichonephila clavipes]|uniref:Uncharacterized protein n=1 Tax=Trichonephila clavipes TaxID=2585209 RepID=A0A8X7BFH6_TRICX|nr:hypothetical protein TNCV_4724261 [Trichonephila clavipes]